MTWFLLTLFLFSFFNFCVLFPPNDESEPESRTHEFITRHGIYGAAAKYLKLRNYVTGIFATDYEILKEYFRSDSDGFERFESAIDIIVKSNNDLQREQATQAKISFNGEQILEGHYRLLYLRGLIEYEARGDSPVVANIRELIGMYLFTLQSFYSNTNWIEMKGLTVNFDLGKRGADILNIASPSENTCKNSFSGQKHLGHCPNNIIVTNKLTSGYKSGQDVEKPESSNNHEGKCSHGGPKDSSINTTANCGINKETLNSISSPHYHLHEHAAAAAIKATEHFISDNGTGLISIFTDRMFEDLFSLKKWTSKSLSYAIDVSGSMANDIASVKSVTKEMIPNLLFSPANYVLATFNDPESLTTGYVTNDATDMINRIDNLVASGGDDCPEYALSGIAKAIALSRYKSDVFLFTDASAKDDYRANEVIRLAIDKRIRIYPILTGSCTTRKRRSIKSSTENSIRKKRQSGVGSVFESLANATGGSLHRISSANLSDVLENLLTSKCLDEIIDGCRIYFLSKPEDSFPNISVTFNQVYIECLWRSENSSSLLIFFVDNDVIELQIQLTGVHFISDISVFYPNDELLNYTSNNNTWRTVNVDKIGIIIPAPLPGQWSILLNVSREINANISGKGSIDFTFKIMKEGADGYLYDVTGNPIAGETYKLNIKLTGDVEQLLLSSLDLIDPTGTEISKYTLAPFSSSNDSRYRADITMPSMKFVFKVTGSDGDGNIVTRIKWLIINPVQVQLTLVPVHNELLINQDHEFQYQIRNLGDTSESFLATIIDNHGFSVPPTERNHAIAAGNTIQDVFVLRPTINPSRLIVYTIEIRQSTSNEILQAISKNVYVTSVKHPSCKIVFVDGKCPLSEVTPSNCTLYTWFAMTETTYSSKAISSITLSNTDSYTKLSTGNTTSLYGPLATNVSGTCCIDIVDLRVLDTDGYLATCRLNFRNKGPGVTIVTDVWDVKNATSKEDDSKNLHIVAITVGVSAAVVLVVLIAIVIKFIVNHTGSFAKVKDPSFLYPTLKKTDTVMRVKFDSSTLEQTET